VYWIHTSYSICRVRRRRRRRRNKEEEEEGGEGGEEGTLCTPSTVRSWEGGKEKEERGSGRVRAKGERGSNERSSEAGLQFCRWSNIFATSAKHQYL
jgi:hypothetical protein